MRMRFDRVFLASSLGLAAACGASEHGLGQSTTPLADSGGSSDAGSSGGDVDGSAGTDGSSSTDASSSSMDGAFSDAVSTIDSSAGSDGSTSADASRATEGGSTGPDASVASFYLGADISFVQQEEASGRHFTDTDGAEKDILQILKELSLGSTTSASGHSSIRSRRTATTPAWGRPRRIATRRTPPRWARGSRRLTGMGFLLDLHMSDTWTDPGHRSSQLAWQGDSFTQLVAQVQSYTQGEIVCANARGEQRSPRAARRLAFEPPALETAPRSRRPVHVSPSAEVEEPHPGRDPRAPSRRCAMNLGGYNSTRLQTSLKVP